MFTRLYICCGSLTSLPMCTRVVHATNKLVHTLLHCDAIPVLSLWRMRVCIRTCMCVNQHHSNTEIIRSQKRSRFWEINSSRFEVELVWRPDFYSIFSMLTDCITAWFNHIELECEHSPSMRGTVCCLGLRNTGILIPHWTWNAMTSCSCCVRHAYIWCISAQCAEAMLTCTKTVLTNMYYAVLQIRIHTIICFVHKEPETGLRINC